jgi:hypothetical protein
MSKIRESLSLGRASRRAGALQPEAWLDRLT